MKIRKLLAAALVLIFVFAAVPVVSLANTIGAATYEARQLSKLDKTWSMLEAAEQKAIKAGLSKQEVIKAVYETALNIGAVDTDSFSDFGKDGFFFTVDGMYCAYNYRLRNELNTANAVPVPENEGIQVFQSTSKVVNTRDAGSPNVLLVAPYYGKDSSFTDQYKKEAQSIANATGGTYTLIQSTSATGPAIAAAYPNKGVIIYDSHGAQNGTSTYLCLTTNTGITTTDYNNGWAVNAGSGTAWIDGRYIQNHISSSLSNPFVWMAICEGMKKEGKGTTGTALLAAGCGGVYGYSQSVSFTGDYKYEAKFWTEMKNGATVKDAIKVMKNTYGVPDPVSGGDAYPIVMSPVDPFPSNPDGAQTVNCTWKLLGGTTTQDPISSVSVSAVNVYVGGTANVNVTVNPSTADYTITSYTSSNTSVATVSSSGVVTGVKAGTATLTVKVKDNSTNTTYTKTATITVSNFEGYVKVDTVEVGEKYIIIDSSAISGTTGYAVGNSVVANSHYLNGVAVTVNSDGTLTIPSSVNANAITWVAGGSASAGYTWKNVANSKYMGLDSSEYVYPSDTAVKWLYDSNKYFNNQVDSEGYYYLSCDSNNSYRYTTSKSGSAIYLYKYTGSTTPDPVYYTVTFKDWDGTVLKTQQVAEGGSATAPSNPTRTGYTFTGWDKSFTNVTSNLTVTAQYTINTYTVTFKDWDGTVLKTQTVNYGGAATAPANPTRDGYTFAGWDKSFNYITANTVVTATYTQNATAEPTPTPTPTPTPDPTDEPSGTYYVPTTTITTGEEYLIGYTDGTNTYVLMNYNPDTSNHYYYNSSSNYYGYAIRAVMSGNNVVGLDTATYTNATLDNVEWKFVANGSYYKIQSAYNSSYYLRVYSSKNYSDMYPSNSTSYATKWSYSNNKLSYYVSSSVTKYAKFYSGSTSDVGYFGAPTSGGSNIILFKKVTGTVTPDPDPTPTPGTTTTYELVTNIEVGQKYIIVAESSISGTAGYAVGNSIVTNSHYLNRVGVTVNSDGTLSIPSGVSVDAITWVAGGSASAGYTWKNVGNNKYMGLDSSEYLYPSATAVNWLYGSDGSFNNQVDSEGYYYLSYDSTNGRYTTSKTAGTIRIYKVVEK